MSETGRWRGELKDRGDRGNERREERVEVESETTDWLGVLDAEPTKGGGELGVGSSVRRLKGETSVAEHL